MSLKMLPCADTPVSMTTSLSVLMPLLPLAVWQVGVLDGRHVIHPLALYSLPSMLWGPT